MGICRLMLVQRLMLVFLTLLFSGCAAIPSASSPPVPVASAPVDTALPEGEGWWYARFHIERPPGEDTRWHVGTLLAGEVIAPVFEHHYNDILIWRIHRRAPRDEFGHVFSFIFYARPAAAERIYADIKNNAVLQQLLQDGRVRRTSFDDISHIRRPEIDDTSDASWVPVVQQTWPALIMGASRMWLDMVTLLAAGQPRGSDLEQRYLAVNKEINRIWAEQGQHAMLHHLSAIYGYQPLMIRY